MAMLQPPALALSVLIGLSCAGCASGPATSPAPPSPDAGTVVELEGRFAAASRERGARTAFLEHLADDSIVLQPGPVFGRAAWESADELPGTLDWAPDWAEMAADGRLGFTTGPWRLTPAAGGGAVAEGRYLTVWRRERDGWKVVFDGGFGRSPGTDPLSLATEVRGGVARCERGPAASAGDLQSLDATLSGTDFEPHAVRVLARMAGEGALFHPPDVAGATSSRAWPGVLQSLPATTQLWPMGGAVATSGDLGYTYGLSSPALAAAAESSYVNLWCRSRGEWRLLAQLRRPLPH